MGIKFVAAVAAITLGLALNAYTNMQQLDDCQEQMMSILSSFSSAAMLSLDRNANIFALTNGLPSEMIGNLIEIRRGNLK